MTLPFVTEHWLAVTHLLEIVSKEAQLLSQVEERLFAKKIDDTWIAALAHHPEDSEQLEAFLSRFSRLQDTIGNRLLPRLRQLLLEEPLPMMEMLNHAEKMNWINSVNNWIDLRELRNMLVHEYMNDPDMLIDNLYKARALVPDLFYAYEHILAQVERVRSL